MKCAMHEPNYIQGLKGGIKPKLEGLRDKKKNVIINIVTGFLYGPLKWTRKALRK